MKALLPKSIKGKVSLIIGSIAVASGLITGFYTYNEEVKKAKEVSKEKVRLTLAFSKSIRGYVRETLRPKIYELMNEYKCIKEDFILEAQSSSFVTSNIFRSVSREFQGLTLRQVAFKPLNPKNEPTPVEQKIIEYFRKTKAPEYTEIVNINNYRYLVSAFPVKVEASCLMCHGKVEICQKL